MNPVVLSTRMQGIVDMLKEYSDTRKKVSCVADVGCDHAFVSIYLIQKGIADRVIAMDVRKGPLEIANTNIHKYGLEKSVETRLSDGLEKLESNEADWAIIAGMGGLLINRILDNGKNHLNQGMGLILQPQSEIDEVRKYLYSHEYNIIDEDFIYEDGKFYTIIKALRGQPRQAVPTCEIMYGPVLLKNKNLILKDYLELQKNKLHELMSRLENADTGRSLERVKEIKSELSVLDQALNYYREV